MIEMLRLYILFLTVPDRMGDPFWVSVTEVSVKVATIPALVIRMLLSRFDRAVGMCKTDVNMMGDMNACEVGFRRMTPTPMARVERSWPHQTTH